MKAASPLTAKQAVKELQALADTERAANLQRFFKTGSGEYGEGDVFIGLKVPTVRKQVRAFAALPLAEVKKLLDSKYHEARLMAVLILVHQFRRGDKAVQKAIVDLYLKSTDRINNWDLIDLSAHHIVGPWLAARSRRPLYRLAKSKSLWERRIAVLSTFHYIRQDDFGDCLGLAEVLLHDKHNLIHKAVGWMLREVGNRDRKVEEAFLKQHYHTMPRTMLRYAIEKFPERLRQAYLKGRVM